MQNRQAEKPADVQVCPNVNELGKSETKIVFNKTGYDPFIDFLKGFCIICVVLTHCIPYKLECYSLFPIWGRPAVPLFLLIQVFHAYKHGIDNVQFNFSKIWRRIIKPFLFIEVAIILIVFPGRLWLATHPNTFVELVKGTISGGGRGPGSYYPWIYLQFAILLTLITPIFKKLHSINLAIFFIVLSQIIELLYNVTNMPMWIYRLLFIRYIFLVYLGYVLVTKGFSINKKTICLSIASLLCLLVFCYTDTDLSPLFITEPSSWTSCHWICYIYMCYLLLFFIKKMYGRLLSNEKILSFMKKTGKYSYEIFLFQMFYFATMQPFFMKILSYIGNSYIEKALDMIIAMMICIAPVVWYKEHTQKANKTKSKAEIRS